MGTFGTGLRVIVRIVLLPIPLPRSVGLRGKVYLRWTSDMSASIAVQQKQMRHADIRTTMNIYGDVVTNQESEAHSKIVGLALPRA